MISESSYQREFESAEALEEKEIKSVEKEFWFRCRQGTRELIYVLVTC
jgi:hypothetical protein